MYICNSRVHNESQTFLQYTTYLRFGCQKVELITAKTCSLYVKNPHCYSGTFFKENKKSPN